MPWAREVDVKDCMIVAQMDLHGKPTQDFIAKGGLFAESFLLISGKITVKYDTVQKAMYISAWLFKNLMLFTIGDGWGSDAWLLSTV